jgi:hypothetical protein
MNGELAGESVEFTSDQAVRPMFVNKDSSFQKRNGSPIRGAAQEHNLWLANLTRQKAGEGQTHWSRVDPGGVTFLMGANELVGMFLERGQSGVLTAVPDFGLPKMIEAFDFSLEARFSRGCKNWNQTQAQTQMDDATQAAGDSVRTLKAGVIVKLSVVRQAKESPVGRQAGQHIQSCKSRLWPSCGQAAIEGNTIEDRDGGAVPYDQVFNEIEGIQFDAAMGQLRQIPPGRGRSETAAASRNEQASPVQYSFDGPGAGRLKNLFLLKSAADSPGAELTQRTMFFEPRTQVENAFDQAWGSAVAWLWIAARTIPPVNSLKPLALRTMKPFPSGTKADLKAASDMSEGRSPAQSGHQAPTFVINFFSIMLEDAPEKEANTLPPLCPPSAAPFGSLALAFPTPPKAGTAPTSNAKAFSLCCRSTVRHFLSPARLYVIFYGWGYGGRGVESKKYEA